MEQDQLYQFTKNPVAKHQGTVIMVQFYKQCTMVDCLPSICWFLTLYFFPGLFFIIFSYFGSFMVVWGLGFWGWGFQLMGFGACGVGPSFFWVGALYINIKE